MKVLVISGFLGAGKTTALIEILRSLVACPRPEGQVPAVIVENEIGDVSIDAQMIAGGGFDVRNLFSGCVCCSLTGELLSEAAVIEREYNPEWLVLETTGIANPGAVADLFAARTDYPCTVIDVIDASRWNRIKIPLATMLNAGLAAADAVLVSKSDLVDADTLDTVESEVRERIKEGVSVFRSTDEISHWIFGVNA